MLGAAGIHATGIIDTAMTTSYDYSSFGWAAAQRSMIVYSIYAQGGGFADTSIPAGFTALYPGSDFVEIYYALMEDINTDDLNDWYDNTAFKSSYPFNDHTNLLWVYSDTVASSAWTITSTSGIDNTAGTALNFTFPTCDQYSLLFGLYGITNPSGGNNTHYPGDSYGTRDNWGVGDWRPLGQSYTSGFPAWASQSWIRYPGGAASPASWSTATAWGNPVQWKFMAIDDGTSSLVWQSGDESTGVKWGSAPLKGATVGPGGAPTNIYGGGIQVG